MVVRPFVIQHILPPKHKDDVQSAKISPAKRQLAPAKVSAGAARSNLITPKVGGERWCPSPSTSRVTSTPSPGSPAP
ncbi:hypothetical protein PVAP13_1KG249500 [Panicum virgatum]|uniref:Uncharacterized protein n=1 Tax=Panicum virgatum TaxID=38727 RepID=A0A8T0XK11_PANVG|nr:hypothetical protein PVAP13_1KG249500 [Panicum virgatum]